MSNLNLTYIMLVILSESDTKFIKLNMGFPRSCSYRKTLEFQRCLLKKLINYIGDLEKS